MIHAHKISKQLAAGRADIRSSHQGEVIGYESAILDVMNAIFPQTPLAPRRDFLTACGIEARNAEWMAHRPERET
jgi:hypothetical protein